MEAIHERRTIKEHRIAAGLTQQELANKIGAHRVSVAQYESGFQEPSASKLLAIADALGINASSIRLEEKRRAS